MRKELDITITDGSPETNRDYGKTFRIREMPAAQAEKWAMRALMTVARTGIDIPEELIGGGMQSVAILGIQAITRVNFDDAEPLLDEMMGCVSVKPDPKNPSIVRPLNGDDDIEEIRTRVKLREEIIKLHVGFSTAGTPLMSDSTQQTPPASSNIQMSPEASVQFSRQKGRR